MPTIPAPSSPSPTPAPPKSLADALLAFQADPPQLVRDAEAEVTNREGRKLYNYTYLTLQRLLIEIQPRLSNLGLLWTAKPVIIYHDGQPPQDGIEYTMTHVPSGEDDTGVMALKVPPPRPDARAPMQDYGAALSFGRRYALIAYLNLAPDKDEDGVGPSTAAASKPITKRQADTILKAAKVAGVIPNIRLIASDVRGEDIGDCGTLAKATTALRKLTGAQADEVLRRIATAGGGS